MTDKAYRVIDNPDGTMSFVELTSDEIALERVRGQKEQARRIAAKGHDCWDNARHEFFKSSRGGWQDSYNCSICGDLLQVG